MFMVKQMFMVKRLVVGLCALALVSATAGTVSAATIQEPCPSGNARCVKTTIKQMDVRFQPLAAACSHQAVFSLAYLRTTEEYARAAAEPGFFINVRFVNREDALFAAYYFDAFDAWAGGSAGVPEAWQIAFNAADRRRVAGSGNLLLGMNAHVNRDLPFVLAQLGLGRKADHDKVNTFLQRVVEPLLAEESARFDPTMDDFETPFGLSYTALFEILKGWREQAWQNAKLLVNAPTPAARALVAAQIEAYAASTARSLVATYAYANNPTLTGAAARDAYCATHG